MRGDEGKKNRRIRHRIRVLAFPHLRPWRLALKRTLLAKGIAHQGEWLHQVTRAVGITCCEAFSSNTVIGWKNEGHKGTRKNEGYLPVPMRI